MLLHWVWFAELKGITLLHKYRLLERFPDPEVLYRMTDSSVRELGLEEKEQTALGNKDLHRARQILEDCKTEGVGILPLFDEAYPQRLRNSPDAPIVLYYRGQLPAWDAAPTIGVVGTRKSTPYGLQVAHQMGGQIAACGGLVVSGGALGGDTAAMQGALAAERPVVGVLGCGVDVAYPACNRELFHKVVENGCLISEYPPGTGAKTWHFPARNRIISGISNGVLVVEAPVQSGALITARYALEQGRDIFAVPGNINNPTCAGSNALLQEGAVPVFSGWDVVSGYAFLYPGKLQKAQFDILYTGEESLAPVAEKSVKIAGRPNKTEKTGKLPVDNEGKTPYDKNRPALSAEEQAVLACLTEVPGEPAQLLAGLDMPQGKALSILTLLTIKGYVQKHPGGTVSLK